MDSQFTFSFVIQRCIQEFRTLLAEVITADAAIQETKDGKTVFTSWSTAKKLLKVDNRYTKVLRKDRESLWRRHVEDIQRRQKLVTNENAEKQSDGRRGSVDSNRYLSGSMRTDDRR
ncbi:hypothetical protein LIER_23958 [Lithospermum erythrorhizon]|uniref:FF domain-containing protein n=1 Tax=Lithospermum erythrorhizon TaxID=34254 RepID=A0AAV3R1M6_LITER